MQPTEDSNKEKVALVTGGSRGIGAAICDELAAMGFRVVVNYVRGNEAAETVKHRIEAAGGIATTLQADVSSYAEIQRMFDAIESGWGPVDVLINNAGYEIRKPSTEYDEATYDGMMDTNLKGAFFCSQRALRTMIGKYWGRIVNISSVHEDRPTGNRSVYSITKAGMRMMTREHALEFAPYGITVNSVVPGAIRTEMNRGVLADPAYEDRVLKMIPAGYIAEPWDVAKLVGFLVSENSSYVNGTSLYVDGGLSLK